MPARGTSSLGWEGRAGGTGESARDVVHERGLHGPQHGPRETLGRAASSRGSRPSAGASCARHPFEYPEYAPFSTPSTRQRQLRMHHSRTPRDSPPVPVQMWVGAEGPVAVGVSPAVARKWQRVRLDPVQM